MTPNCGSRSRAAPRLAGISGLVFLLAASALPASDACQTRAIHTTANVAVSDGSAFRTESLFRAADQAVIRHLGEEEQTVAVEGPLAWIGRGDRAQLGDDGHKRFALGHQYHALLLHFDELVEEIEPPSELDFGGATHPARGGSFPYGGRVYEVTGVDASRPLGYRMELPQTPPIEVRLDDWRTGDGVTLPHRVVIDDGTLRFDYRYEQIDLGQRPPGWFSDAVPAPGLDRLQIYRLHREILAAHCAGDAARLAELTAPEITVASGGQLLQSTREETLQRFTDTFQRLDYDAYVDRVEPTIEVAESGDIGWIAVEVQPRGSVIQSGAAFDSQWAWVMLVRKVDGRWLNAGNAANHGQ
jgi:ketosteroid isomerase-like protein